MTYSYRRIAMRRKVIVMRQEILLNKKNNI